MLRGSHGSLQASKVCQLGLEEYQTPEAVTSNGTQVMAGHIMAGLMLTESDSQEISQKELLKSPCSLLIPVLRFWEIDDRFLLRINPIT